MGKASQTKYQYKNNRNLEKAAEAWARLCLYDLQQRKSAIKAINRSQNKNNEQNK